jgi:uncharacterized protein (DUF427 family)
MNRAHATLSVMPRESLWSRYPDYRVDLDASDEVKRVRYAGKVIAESSRAFVVRETKHDPVVYFPREDVRLEHMERTDHQTFCPFKGEASYWTLRVGGQVSENTAWSYEAPFPEVAGLKDYVAFYADRVEWD